MPQPVAVVFVHGIHTLEPGYEKDMHEHLVLHLPKQVREHVTFRAVYWADGVRKRQGSYIETVEKQRLFKNDKYRKMVVQGLGDAAAYQKTKSFRNSSYYEIQGEVRSVLEELDSQGIPERPLVFIGHSLGCHIISTFVWDINSIKHFSDTKLAGEDEEVRRFADYLKNGSPFRRLDTLAGLIMMGSNMPLFTFTFGPDRVMPITLPRNNGETPGFPGRALDAATLKHVRWLNYYSRNDILGYPLKPLNDAYAAEPLLSDIEVPSEGRGLRAVKRLSPAYVALKAHSGYWCDSRVVRGAAQLITALSTAHDPPRKKLLGLF